MAVWAGFLNAVMWVVVPLFLYRSLGESLSTASFAVSLPFILAFGIPITVLQALGALTMGMAPSVLFLSGSYLAEAFYIWSAANGGVLSFKVQAISVGLFFQPLLFLLMLPSLFWSVRVPLTFLLEQSEAGQPSPDEV
jgi:hypothetical protein